MDKAILRTLNEPTLLLLAETRPTALRTLDEDALCDLHTRIRQQRNKHTKLYRRKSSAQVARSGSRGVARPKHPRTAAKAELYEDALARVSAALAKAARGSAVQLRAERLRVAHAPSNPLPQRRGGRGAPGARFSPPKQPAHRNPRTPITRKRHAATRAAGARRQARRDNRP